MTHTCVRTNTRALLIAGILQISEKRKEKAQLRMANSLVNELCLGSSRKWCARLWNGFKFVAAGEGHCGEHEFWCFASPVCRDVRLYGWQCPPRLPERKHKKTPQNSSPRPWEDECHHSPKRHRARQLLLSRFAMCPRLPGLRLLPAVL